jgi:cytochrome c peroxidase
VAALVAFQESLIVTESRFDRFYLGGDSTALSATEVRGWRLFRSGRAGCGGCHVPFPEPGGSGIIVFSDRRFHNLGVGYENGRMEDVGRYGVTRQPRDWGAFMTPSLRNVSMTAPYMHDGSVATLEDVVEFYEKGGVKNPEIVTRTSHDQPT